MDMEGVWHGEDKMPRLFWVEARRGQGVLSFQQHLMRTRMSHKKANSAPSRLGG